MTTLHLTRGDNYEGVCLRLPAAPVEIGEAFAMLDEISRYAGDTKIAAVTSPIGNLGQYIRCADMTSGADTEKLNRLAENIDGMSERERQIFSGALDAESINGLDNVLKLAEHLNDYVLLPNISTDTELGRFLVDTGYKNFPEAVQPHLDYAAIGAEYYANNGGAYGPGGYVRRKSSLEQDTENRPSLITLHLFTQKVAMAEPYRLHLPATDEELDQAKALLCVDCFTEAAIVKVEFGQPYLAELIPQECICVEDADELALEIEEMRQENGELLKYLAVLSAEQPDSFPSALHLALELDDYEQITEGTYEYGQSVLRRIGADDELIATIDGYMDFEKFGEDAMAEDGIRQTEFGLVRRLSEPFPQPDSGMQMA